MCGCMMICSYRRTRGLLVMCTAAQRRVCGGKIHPLIIIITVQKSSHWIHLHDKTQGLLPSLKRYNNSISEWSHFPACSAGGTVKHHYNKKKREMYLLTRTLTIGSVTTLKRRWKLSNWCHPSAWWKTLRVTITICFWSSTKPMTQLLTGTLLPLSQLLFIHSHYTTAITGAILLR